MWYATKKRDFFIQMLQSRTLNHNPLAPSLYLQPFLKYGFPKFVDVNCWAVKVFLSLSLYVLSLNFLPTGSHIEKRYQYYSKYICFQSKTLGAYQDSVLNWRLSKQRMTNDISKESTSWPHKCAYLSMLMSLFRCKTGLCLWHCQYSNWYKDIHTVM